jgi:Lon protease-like protein
MRASSPYRENYPRKIVTGGSVSSLLPIFPLELVLLPGVPLPLHIFEPRYKEMIAECLEQKKPFGVVRASRGSRRHRLHRRDRLRHQEI